VQNASLVRTLLRERLADHARGASEHDTTDGRATAPATILVTHDVVDAMVLADRVAIVDNGRIVDSGQTARVLGQPANLFAATLVGLNLVEGTVETPTVVRTLDGRRFVSDAALPAVGSDVSVVFPPSAVTLRVARNDAAEPDPAAAARLAPNSWHATVGILEPAARGIRATLRGDTIVAETTPAELLAQQVSPGDRVTASVDAAGISVYPRRVAR